MGSLLVRKGDGKLLVSVGLRLQDAQMQSDDIPAAEPSEDDAPFLFEDTEPVHRVTYSVRLSDYPHPAADAGDDAVPALRAFQNASESGESDLTKGEIVLAKRWAKACDAARTAGFRDLGDTDEAFFDLRAI